MASASVKSNRCYNEQGTAAKGVALGNKICSPAIFHLVTGKDGAGDPEGEEP